MQEIGLFQTLNSSPPKSRHQGIAKEFARFAHEVVVSEVVAEKMWLVVGCRFSGERQGVHVKHIVPTAMQDVTLLKQGPEASENMRKDDLVCIPFPHMRKPCVAEAIVVKK
jgi:hypothetical protein